MQSDLVLTPGGYRHRSLVHHVDSAHAVHFAKGKLHLLDLESKSLKEIVRPKLKPGDVPGFGTGWITYADWTNSTGTPVSYFSTTWVVPPAPATSGNQTIFLFNGIDPADISAAILQPVLQWGESAAGGGAFWSVASWYVLGDGTALHTDLVQVNPGDTLQGVMTLTGQSGGLFSYSSEFIGIANTTLPVQNIAELVWCNETLECYGITACSDYPDADFTAMKAIQLETGGPAPVSWSPENAVTDCGQHTIVVDDSSQNGQVNLYYRQPSKSPFEGVLSQYAQYIDILFGVTNDGGGIGIVGGHIIHIPPWDPDGPIYREIAKSLGEVLRGFAVNGALKGVEGGRASAEIRRASLTMISESLQKAAHAAEGALKAAVE